VQQLLPYRKELLMSQFALGLLLGFPFGWFVSLVQNSEKLKSQVLRKDLAQAQGYLMESEYQLAMLKSQYQQLQTQKAMETEKEKAAMEWDLKK
jgi:ABC-type multidrug transport system fused ATPase/permease subunit